MHVPERIVLICDPLLSEYGPLRPAILLAEGLMEKGLRVAMMSTTVSDKLQAKLDLMGIETVNLGKKPLLKKNESIAWLEEWAREAAFGLNSHGAPRPDGVTLNFSNTLNLSAYAWYAQGPPTTTLDNMRNQLSIPYRTAYLLLSPLFKVFDVSLTRKIADGCTRVVANSEYLRSIYGGFGVRADHVIYPPLNCDQFKPAAASPSRDFALTYFGKETIFGLVKQALDAGVKIKAFGSKLAMVPRWVRQHPNLDCLGRVDDAELVSLYSNALFTFYPFTDEPFGYIPVESLACGTPVMTFNKHGPRETVSDGRTGWLADDDTDLLRLTIRVWKSGYSGDVTKQCRESATRFDFRTIAKEWLALLDGTCG